MIVRRLGRVDYAATFEAMRRHTAERIAAGATEAGPPDELWLCEHPPVYTLGLAGREAHLHAPDPQVPVVRTDRGGQVTYHGPGQVVAYPLVDLRRLRIYVKEYVYRLEHAVLKTLESFGITGHRVPGAPGIYVRLDDPRGHAALEAAPPRERLGVAAADPFAGLGKVAALGIKVSQHRTYHGLALNVAMDLGPFQRIDPCGYAGLHTVDLATLGLAVGWDDVADRLAGRLVSHLSP
ncbi:lipoyl(octanoyl) transferase LipB [Piscinibacter sakaiensis]|uniref:Octanoyltransferase n=1 Tax=Piscinibacter sakaiensis TaxID=1547922 RepID=A0A0K8P5T7_PISS1|nr:lipoyl(octanoyl) transferase LipB [Piscinibacter sakaiensis]GAP37560.1 octanoate-ACP-protein-N-octanoyltransferase [Piscinibacter sakaiensis]